MRRLALGLLALALLAACNSPAKQAKVGQAAPSVSGATVDGGHLSLATYRGAPVLVNFWASWCNPCREELPRLAAQSTSGTKVVGVDVSDSDRLAKQFAAAAGVSYPSLADPQGSTAAHWGVGKGLPVTFAVDAKGVVRASHFGELSDADIAKLTTAAAAT